MREHSGGGQVATVPRTAGGSGEAPRTTGRVPAPRRPTSGPRPVRPRMAVVPVRPVQPARPTPTVVQPGQRVLLRPVPVLPARILRRRRVAAMIGMALLTAAVVVALGLLADVAAAARASSGSPGDAGSSLTAVAGPSGQVAGPPRR